jgi:hypothetical protein
MQIIDDTGVPALVPFSAIAVESGFMDGDVLYAKRTSSNAVRFPDLTDIPFAANTPVSPRDLALHFSFPA